MNNLHAKALRAAEWFREDLNGSASYYPTNGWSLINKEDHSYVYRGISDSMFIAFCEDRGWIDTAEDEGVATELSIKMKPVPGGWEWKLMEVGCVCTAFGQEPTRAEARRAALEAARGLDAN